MSALQEFINQKNRWYTLIGEEEFEVATARGRQRVGDQINHDLSPENLSCDGELSRSQVNARYRRLTSVAKQLVKLDPSVKIYELYTGE